MHLFQAKEAEFTDGSKPVDLRQTPADVIVISATDSEIAAFSVAYAELENGPKSLRLANLQNLSHAATIDKYLDDTASKARFVIIRAHGGVSCWPYGMAQFSIRLKAAGVALALLPGDDKPDSELRDLSSVSDEDYEALWAYLVEGGPENMAGFLCFTRHMLDGGEPPAAAKTLVQAGIYSPGLAQTSLKDLRQTLWQEGQPVVAIVFYRALVQGAGLDPLNQMIRAQVRQGLNPLPIFVTSRKDPCSAASLAQIFERAPPDVVLNGTRFAVSLPQSGVDENSGDPLGATIAPVLQIEFFAGAEAEWEENSAGLSTRDMDTNVSQPEIDGCDLTRAISFKGAAYLDEATECLITTYHAHSEPISFVVTLAANWAKLGKTPAAERKVALVLSNFPNKDGQLANGVGLDTPAATVGVLNALSGAGYRVTNQPDNAANMMARLLAGPANRLTDRARLARGERLSMADYQIDYGQLPAAVRTKIEERWGPPEADPFFTPGEVDCGHFTLSILSFGNVVVGVQPAYGDSALPTDRSHSPDLVPPHNYFAFYFWLRHQFRANAIVHVGKSSNTGRRPGKAQAICSECFHEAAFGPTPHFYPLIVSDPTAHPC